MLGIKNNVPMVTGITPDNISESLLNSDVPMVLKNFAEHWPIVQASLVSPRKTAEYIRSHDEGLPINACYIDAKAQGRVFFNDNMNGFNFETKHQSLNDVFHYILENNQDTDNRELYIGSTSIRHYLPSMVKDVAVTPLMASSLLNIWLGTKTKVAAHFDAAQNLAIVGSGKRRFVLFPPEQLLNLYIGPLEKGPGGQPISLVDFNAPDFEKYPLFETALQHAQFIELDAGDAIIIPSMWWHYVEGLNTFNVLINYWWQRSAGYLGRPMNALLHGIWAIRSLPQSERSAWQKLFEHYIFNHDNSNFEHLPSHINSISSSPIDELFSRKIRAELQNKLRK